MSEVRVNKISPRSGTTVTLGDNGDTISIPSGVTLDASNATTTLPANVVTTTGSQTLTNKTIDASQLTGTITPSDNTVTPAKLAYNYNQFRNIIINGDMSIAQRSTSVASITTTGYYTLDRFQTILTTLGTWTQSQDTDVPTGQGFATSLKMDCTTADASPSAGDTLFIIQRFEGQNLQYLKKGTANAVSTTLSFWVKSTKTGTFIAELFDEDNNRQISKSYTVNVTDTWEKKTITFEGDTAGALTNDNNLSLGLNFWLSAGTNFTSGTLNTSWNSSTSANRAVGQVNFADSTSNDFWITGVQLEAGTASDFEFLPVDVNLERCQRYYQKLSISLINLNTTGLTGFVFPVEMRANPSVSRSYLGNANRMYNVGTGATADVVSPVTLVSTKTVRYWYAFSPAAWATATRSSWETDYTMDSEL